MGLVRLAGSQRALPGAGQQERERSGALMEALDACNRRFGRGTVVTASAGVPKVRTWATKFEMRSPRYTTRLSDLPVIGMGMGAVHAPRRTSARRRRLRRIASDEPPSRK